MQYLIIVITFYCFSHFFPSLSANEVLLTLLLADKVAGLIKNFSTSLKEILRKKEQKGEGTSFAEEVPSHNQWVNATNTNIDYLIAGFAKIVVIFTLLLPMTMTIATSYIILHK